MSAPYAPASPSGAGVGPHACDRPGPAVPHLDELQVQLWPNPAVPRARLPRSGQAGHCAQGAQRFPWRRVPYPNRMRTPAAGRPPADLLGDLFRRDAGAGAASGGDQARPGRVICGTTHAEYAADRAASCGLHAAGLRLVSEPIARNRRRQPRGRGLPLEPVAIGRCAPAIGARGRPADRLRAQRGPVHRDRAISTAPCEAAGMTGRHCLTAVRDVQTAVDGVSEVAIDLRPGGVSTVTVTSSAAGATEADTGARGHAGAAGFRPTSRAEPEDRCDRSAGTPRRLGPGPLPAG